MTRKSVPLKLTPQGLSSTVRSLVEGSGGRCDPLPPLNSSPSPSTRLMELEITENMSMSSATDAIVLSGDVFDGVQLSVLLNTMRTDGKCLTIFSQGVKGIVLTDCASCAICTRPRPERGLFIGHFKAMPEEENLRNRHFGFFTAHGHQLRPADLDAYTVPIITRGGQPGESGPMIIYHKVSHIPCAALGKLAGLNPQFEWSIAPQQLRIKTGPRSPMSTVLQHAAAKRRRLED
uniref:ORF29 n=1 Tax=Latid herpesvirus 1 TaxID=3096545 RepID=A0AB33V6Z0_9VIRU